MTSANTNHIVPDLIHFFDDERKVIRKQILKRSIYIYKYILYKFPIFTNIRKKSV